MRMMNYDFGWQGRKGLDDCAGHRMIPLAFGILMKGAAMNYGSAARECM